MKRLLALLLLLAPATAWGHPPPVPSEWREDGTNIIFTPAEIIDCQDSVTCTNNNGVIEIDASLPGGAGDITDVGPGCASGACFTDGNNDTLVFEGATNNTVETTFGATDPTVADQTYNLPDAAASLTDTLVALTVTQTLTNKTIAAGDNVVTADDLICTNCIDDTEVTTNAGTALSADLEEEVTAGSLANDTILEEDLKVVDAASDEDILTRETTTGDFEWHTCAEITGSADLCDGNDATGVGGGDAITVNTTAATDANLKDSSQIAFAIDTGTTPDDVTASVVSGSLSATELGTDSVSADELNATGVETELEAALDIGGEVTSTGMGSTVVADSLTVTGWVLGTSSATTLTAGTVNIDLLDAVGAVDMDYGSADVTDHTFTTDGTGDAEFVVPNDSIGVNEIGDDAILESMLKAVDAAADEECLTREETTGDFEWQPCGSGSGDDIDWEHSFAASSMEPLEAADSIPPLTKTAGTNLDEFSVSFDAATDEGRKVTLVVPESAASGNVTFMFYWWSATATTGNVVWDVRSTATGADGESWDATLTTNTATCTVAGTVTQFDVCTITETLANLGWAAGDRITLMLYRDANNASDTMAGDAELSMVKVRVPVS